MQKKSLCIRLIVTLLALLSASFSYAAPRIITLTPSATEIVAAAGAGRYLVGTDKASNYPVYTQSLPKIANHEVVNSEALLILHPTLIVAEATVAIQDLLAKLPLQNANIYLLDTTKLENIPLHILAIGRLAGTEAAAQRAAFSFQDQFRQLQRRYQYALPPLSVFYQLWQSPLLTVNGHSIVSQIIHLCGGKNIFADTKKTVLEVDREAVLLANPQVIMASVPEQASHIWQKFWYHWPGLQAVHKNNLFTISPDLLQRYSPRILSGASIVCQDLAIARVR